MFPAGYLKIRNYPVHKMKSFELSYRNLNRTLLSTVTLLAIDEQSSPVKCQSDVTEKCLYMMLYIKEECHDTAFCRDLFILGGARSSGDFSSYN